MNNTFREILVRLLQFIMLLGWMNGGLTQAQTLDKVSPSNQTPNQNIFTPRPKPTPNFEPNLKPITPQEPLNPSIPKSPQSPEIKPEKTEDTIVVERFKVIGSTVFSPEELEKVTKDFTRKNVTYTDLLKARSAVTKLYFKNGYKTSGAFIPEQDIEAGVVKIQVIEGELEGEIEVQGNRRLGSKYIRSRLARATSKPLNIERLQEALRLLRLNPLIKDISAELSTGSTPAKSFLQVQIKEADTFSIQTSIDNGRSPSVGSFRRRLQVREANLLGGIGDDVVLGYANTDGSNSLDLSYTLPLNPKNGYFRFSYGTTSSNVIEPPFKKLDIEANSRYYEITLRQPIIQTVTGRQSTNETATRRQSANEFAIGLTASRLESETSLLSIRFPLSAGADDEGRTRVSALRFFQEWTQRTNEQVIALRSQFSLGLGGVLNSTINSNAPDSRFFAWRGQAQWVRRFLPSDISLSVSGNVQLADRTLLGLEQFALGGQESIRGYRQDALLGDNGAFISAEVELPIYRTSNRKNILQLIPFIDIGTVWNNSIRASPNRDALASDTLASVGLGLQWRGSNNFTTRIDWGIPLISIPEERRTWQEQGLYFSVQYNPF
ncbi:MAG: ShlB/FhaC/HecB family hemolysin secretion/activation protein [Nostocaceae cyanobacterium]|nr:ShlB/FhaC/HecB family hemolysin secretion/activation protein [Nostocaceae cyanobacterium]